MTTLGKYIGGGMSFGAFGGKAEIMERYDPRRPDAIPHAGTFNNNVLTMAAGHAGLTQLFPAKVAEAHFQRGEVLRQALNAASVGVMQWTGLGSMACVHFRSGPIVRIAPADAREIGMRELFFFDMLQRGFYLARRGMIALSLEVTASDTAAFVEAVSEFASAHAGLLQA
jgi:glutamate-1-semialdehyde 2,1-aminomutase